jgi:hypothetical protein
VSPEGWFYAAHVYGNSSSPETPTYTRSGFSDPEEALRDAAEHAQPGQVYEARWVSRRSHWIWAMGDHSLPIEGRVVLIGGNLQQSA